MNYQRRENLDIILDSLRSQNVEIEIFLWNNSNEPFVDKRVDWVVNSSNNVRCWSRWFMAQYAKNDLVMSLDDDLVFHGKDSFQILIDEYQSYKEPGRAMGLFGVQYNGDHRYYIPLSNPKNGSSDYKPLNIHIDTPDENTMVDIVKGRCLLIDRNDLINVPLAPEYIEFGDDIMISYYLSLRKKWFKNRRAKRHHIITNVLNERVQNLKEDKGEMALSSTKNWFEIRSGIMNHYFQKK